VEGSVTEEGPVRRRKESAPCRFRPISRGKDCLDRATKKREKKKGERLTEEEKKPPAVHSELVAEKRSALHWSQKEGGERKQVKAYKDRENSYRVSVKKAQCLPPRG